MNRPPVTTKAANAPDSACSDPLCSYRAEIEGGYWLDPSQVLLLDNDTAVERLRAPLRAEVPAFLNVDDMADIDALTEAIIAALREGRQR